MPIVRKPTLFRFPQELVDALDRSAAHDLRKRQAQAEIILTDYLKRNGFLKKTATLPVDDEDDQSE